MYTLATAEQLEDVVGARTAPGRLKEIHSLDEHCLDFLAHSPFAMVGFQREDGSQASLPAGGDPGSLAAIDPEHLSLPIATDLAKQHGAVDGAAAGLVALVPGYGESLRVNGRLRLPDNRDTVVLDVEAAFLHCAKCMLRSKLWTDPVPAAPADATTTAGDLSDPAITSFLARSPFLTMTTTDASGGCDVSPKGDPAGFVAVIDQQTLAIPDRPGNRRTDTMHNLIEHPAVAVAAFVPGDDRLLHVTGRARITDDAATRALLEINGNVPKAAILVTIDHAELRRHDTLAASGIWDHSAQVEKETMPRASQIWTDHVKSNQNDGD